MLPAPVSVQAARNPFEGARVQAYATEGQTVAEIIAEQGLRQDDAYTVAAFINGERVPSSMLERVKPKGGAQLVLRVVPQGGDSGKAVLSIVIGVLTIAAAVFMPAGLAAAGMFGGAGITAAEGMMAASLLLSGTMGIATGIQSLAAPPPQVPFSGTIPTSQDSAALTGTKNTARLYGPVRTVIGRYRVYPDLIAKPFTERVGKDSVLRLLFCFGYGPLDVTDIKIGETPIGELVDSSKWNLLQGWDDDPALSIFRDDVDQDSSIQPALPRENPEVANLTSSPGPEELSIDLTFAAGLIGFDERGKPVPVTVRIQVEEREQGGAWTNIGTPSAGLDESSGVTEVSAGLFDIKLAERGMVTRGLRWTVPVGSTPNAVHEVRVTRVSTTTGGDQVFSDAQITVIRSIKPHQAAQISNLCKLELEINASETGLSNVVDNLSAVCTSILPRYDVATSTWGPTHANASAYNSTMFPTRNAAWAFAQVLRGPANSRPVADERIDGPSIAAWAGNLEGTGAQPISGSTSVARNTDAVVDYNTTARKLLADIAGAGRAALNLVDGRYGVVQDIARSEIVQHFSPRNSSGFSGAKSFRKNPHAVRVHYVNPDKAYQRDELVVYDDGYNLDGSGADTAASEFAELTLWGVADSEQAWRDGRYHLASTKLRPEVFTITADVEHIVANRGDLVRVSHDVIGVGYGGARLTEVTNAGGAFVSGTMDEEFVYDSNKSYAARIRQADGYELFVELDNPGKSSTALTALNPATYSGSGPAVGDLLLFGELESESLLCLIQRVSPRNDLTARIELIEYNAAVYDPGSIPEFSSNVSLQNQPSLLKPQTPEIVGDPVSDETVLAYSSSGAPEPRISLEVNTPQHDEGTYAPTTHYHAQYRASTGTEALSDWINASRVEATGATTILIGPVDQGQMYQLRVRAISDSAASASDWTSPVTHTVVGASTPPPAVTNLTVLGDHIRWSYGAEPDDFAGFRVKHQAGSDSTWATGTSLTANLVTENYVPINNRLEPGTTTIMVRAVDLANNESETVSVTRNIVGRESLNAMQTNVQTAIWAGVKTNCTADSGSGELWADTVSSPTFWGSGTASFYTGTGASAFWGNTVYADMSYMWSTFINNSNANNFPSLLILPAYQRISELEFEAAEINIEFRWVTSLAFAYGIGFVYTYTDWMPWPGFRHVTQLEYKPFLTGMNLDLEYEYIELRVSLKSGAGRAKLKQLSMVLEGPPKAYNDPALSVAAAGTTIDLSDLGWRKITNLNVTPTASGSSTQGLLSPEVVDVTANDGNELTGPKVYLRNSSGTATTGTASVTIEGY